MEQLGTYSDAATFEGFSQDPDSTCVGYGTFTFIDGSEISLSYTCGTRKNSITGGQGRFGCASGFEGSFEIDDVVSGSTLYLCGSLCAEEEM